MRRSRIKTKYKKRELLLKQKINVIYVKRTKRKRI